MIENVEKTPSPIGSIARAAGLVMVLFVLSRVLGLVREMAIAHQFGTSPDYEAYLAAFRLPDFLFYLVAGGALGSAFIPTYAGYLAKGDEAGARRLASAIINWVFIILTGLSILAALFAPLIVNLLVPGFSPAQKALTASLMRLMLSSTIIFGVSGILMGILNARQHFLLPALAPVFYNCAIILGAVFLGPRLGVVGLAIGVVAGALAHLLIQLPGLAVRRLRYIPVLALADPGVHEVVRLMAPRVLGIAAVQINFMVNTYLSSSLPAGSLSGLNYGWLIMLLPQGIIAQAVATAAFPTFSILASNGDLAGLKKILNTTLHGIVYLTLPASIGLILLSRPIVQLLFERGAFNAQSTAATTWALSFFALGLVGHSVIEIATRAYYAMHDTKTPVIIAVAAMAANIILSLILIRLFAALGLMAHGGLALANSLAAMGEMTALLLILQPRLARRGKPAGSNSIAMLMSLASLAMIPFLLLQQQFMQHAPAWLNVLAGVCLGGMVYFLLTYFMGLEEPRVFLKKAAGRLSRPQASS